MESEGVYSRTFCNQCQRETNHSVRHCLSNDRNDGTSQAPHFVREEWLLLKCNGCDSIQVRVTENVAKLQVASMRLLSAKAAPMPAALAC